MPNSIVASPLVAAEPAAAETRLLLYLRVRRDHLAGLVFRRLKDDFGLAVLERLEPAALDALPLHFEHARFRPFAVLAEADVADDRLERLAMHEVRHLFMVERLGALDRAAEHLQIGIGERRQIPAERVDPRRRRLGLVLLQEVENARELHRLRRDPEVVIDDAVELGAELLLD